MIARRLACSFCRRHAAEVAKLVAGPRLLLAGPRVYICDRCVGAADEIMRRDAGEEPQNPAPRHGFLRRVCRRVARVWQRSGPLFSQRPSAAR